MPGNPDLFFHGGEAGGYNPAFPDVSFENERAMWWAEFDSVGEETVRGSVERNSYTPTGMEIARQWLARREFFQLREDVQSLRALAEQVQATAFGPLRTESEALALAGQVDANTRAIAEITATAKKNARAMVWAGTAVSLLALCAVVMVLASSRQAAPDIKQASAQPLRAKQAAVQPPPPAVLPPQPGHALAPEQAPAILPENASAIPTENMQPRIIEKELSNAPQNKVPELKPGARSAAEVLAMIADKVGSEGTVDFTAQFHDAATGRDHTEQLLYRASNVTIDPNRCQVGYHWHVEQNGRELSDQDRTIELRLGKKVWMRPIDAESGRRFSMRADPQVYVVQIARWENASGDTLYFHDKDTAARVATATRRALNLCDDGERQFPRR